MARRAYNSDLNDGEWALLAPLIPAPLPRGRPIKWERREIVTAILYVLRSYPKIMNSFRRPPKRGSILLCPV